MSGFERLHHGINRRQFLSGMCSLLALPPAGEAAQADYARPVVVAGTVSFSGAFREIGLAAHRGITLWADQVNSGGGLSGRPVWAVFEDDESSPDAARNHFERLAPGSDLLLAPYGSWLTGAILPIVEATGRPCIVPSAGNRSLWAERRRWSVQLLNPSYTMLNGVVELAQRSRMREVAFVHRDDPFSEAVVNGAARHARALGLQVQSNATYQDRSQALAAARALARSQPQFVSGMGLSPGGRSSGFLDDALMLLEVFAQSGVRAPLTCLGIGAADRRFADRASVSVEGVIGSTGWRSYLATPGNEDFVAAFTGRWGEPPDIHAAQGYAAGQLMEQSWRQVDAGRDSIPRARALRDALFSMDTETVFGRYCVNRRGLQVGKTNAIVQWQQGRPRVVWPARYASGDFTPRATG